MGIYWNRKHIEYKKKEARNKDLFLTSFYLLVLEILYIMFICHIRISIISVKRLTTYVSQSSNIILLLLHIYQSQNGQQTLQLQRHHFP